MDKKKIVAAAKPLVAPLAIAALTALLTHTSVKKALTNAAKDLARDKLGA